MAVATQPGEGRADLLTSPVVHLAVTCGGVAALSWEVLWQLAASLSIGVSALGTALTLAAAMGGMAIGSLGMSQWLAGRTPERPLRLYGLLEIVIGVAGLLMGLSFAAAEVVDRWIFQALPAATPVAHALLILLVLAPATVAMGATVPVFQAVADRHRLHVSALYGANTAGACVGVLLVSFVLLPRVGVFLTAVTVAALNGVAFLITRWLPAPDGEAQRDAGAETAAAAPGISMALAVAFVIATGFATFALEVAWFRALRAAFWSTTATFAIILASVLAPLALGARAVPWLRQRGMRPELMLALAGVAVLLATPVVERMDLLAQSVESYEQTLVRWLGLSLLTLGPAIFLLGTILPWALEEFSNARDTGRLYAWNTGGAVAGSLVSAWLLLPAIGFAPTAWLMGGLLLLLAVVAARPRPRWAIAATGVVALALAVTTSSSPGRHRAYREATFGNHRIIALEEGPDSTASVVQDPTGRRLLMIDGFIATTEHAIANYMEWMGRLPMLLHPSPDRALVIAFGTGQTAWAVLDEGPTALDIAEVSAGVLALAEHFESNNGVLEDRRVEPIVMDGRAWLRRTDRDYDVITLEPMPPNFAGVNALYSIEFYEILASRLRPGGIVAQWLPMHLVSTAHSEAIARTFLDVFPDSILWIDPITNTGILVGRVAEVGSGPLASEWPGFDREATTRTYDRPEVEKWVILGADGLARYTEGADAVTDDNQLLAFSRTRAGVHSSLGKRVRERSLRKILRVRDRP